MERWYSELTVMEELDLFRKKNTELLSQLLNERNEYQVKTLELKVQMEKYRVAFEKLKKEINATSTTNGISQEEFQTLLFQALDKLVGNKSQKRYCGAEVAQIIAAFGEACRPSLIESMNGITQQSFLLQALDKIQNSGKNYVGAEIAQIIAAIGVASAIRPTAVIDSPNLNNVLRAFEADIKNIEIATNRTETRAGTSQNPEKLPEKTDSIRSVNLPDNIWDADVDEDDSLSSASSNY